MLELLLLAELLFVAEVEVPLFFEPLELEPDFVGMIFSFRRAQLPTVNAGSGVEHDPGRSSSN